MNISKFIFFVLFNLTLSVTCFSAEITTEQALELGMSPYEEYLSDHLNKNLKTYDFYNDEVNSTLAAVVIIVNESDRSISNPEGQTAKVFHFGELKGIFSVSTGSRKVKTTTDGRQYIAITREGFFRPKKLYRDYYSYTFFGAGMPYATFFNGGIALHGTNSLNMLGKRASGGCVRFDPKDIKLINELIRTTGEGHERVLIKNICRPVDVNGNVIKNPDHYRGITKNKCYQRSLHLDRVKIENIHRHNGNTLDNTIWSYDALIVVKSP
tara:strand:+ start:1722 stop:2525 length:804 start_codon:yes stop_codon:yes gene_type:complete